MEGGFQRGEKRRKRRSLAAVWLGPEGSSLLEQWKHQHDLTDAFSAVKKATEVASLSFFFPYGHLSFFLQFLFVPKPHPTPSYLLWLGLFAPFPDVFIKISSHPIITERLLPTVWEEVLLWVLSAGGRRILVAVQWVCLRLINRRDCVILTVFFFFWNLHRLRCKIRFLKPKFEWGDIKIGPSTTKKQSFHGSLRQLFWVTSHFREICRCREGSDFTGNYVLKPSYADGCQVGVKQSCNFCLSTNWFGCTRIGLWKRRAAKVCVTKATGVLVCSVPDFTHRHLW